MNAPALNTGLRTRGLTVGTSTRVCTFWLGPAGMGLGPAFRLIRMWVGTLYPLAVV